MIIEKTTEFSPHSSNHTLTAAMPGKGLSSGRERYNHVGKYGRS
jgi:hypothetical protein